MWRQLVSSQFYSDKELDLLQEKKLRALLNHAKLNSKYYSDKLNDIDVDSITIDNMSLIPLLSKDDFRKNLDSIFSAVYRRDECFLSETSGSTGDALVFYRDRGWDAAHRSAIYRGMGQFGVRPWDKNIYFWGFIFTRIQKVKVRFLDKLQNRERLFFQDDKSITRLLDKIEKFDYIEGYSSVVNNVAVEVIKRGKTFNNIRMVKCTSEKIYPIYYENVKKAFGVDIVSEYGAAETGIIAFSCPKGKMHVVRENVILEEVNGKAVVTNLESYSMPIIRYELGDYVEVIRSKCECGQHSQIVNDVLGRIGSEIVGNSKSFPSLTLYYVFKFLALEKNIKLSYQAVQRTVGKLEVGIVESFDGEEFRYIEKEVMAAFKLYFDDEVEPEVVFGHKAKNTKKMKDFESLL
ncbi:hypothetical protein [Shewanella algae]|uniref:hypothetical protein n=1 Tax=Shewanella algae TaxID=38313 RepID=UPI0031F56D10